MERERKTRVEELLHGSFVPDDEHSEEEEKEELFKDIIQLETVSFSCPPNRPTSFVFQPPTPFSNNRYSGNRISHETQANNHFSRSFVVERRRMLI